MRFLLLFVVLSLHVHARADWAEKTLQSMTLDEKVGQLFMIAGYVDQEYASRETENPRIIEEIESYVKDYAIGGIGLVGPSTSTKQVILLNRYQEMSKYPLLIAQDFEWGLSMRLTDGMRFPKNITLGALRDNSLIYEMGKEIGRQGKLVGVQMNLSPDMDVNIEPENPVINVRSFGSSPQEVALKGIAMIKGLQDADMIASAKHFPGLGDITTDPHLALPINLSDKKRLEEIELYPFHEAIKAGVLSIQTDHVLMPALEPDTKLPSSLSPNIVQGILKDKMGFQGLVLSGALRMKALSDNWSQEEIAYKAFVAGSDMLLMPKDFPRAFNAIKTAVNEGKISKAALDERVLKILKLKEHSQLHLNRKLPLPTQEQLHTPEAKALKRRLYKAIVTVVKDENKLLPLKSTPKSPVAYVQIGGDSNSPLYNELKTKLDIEPYFLALDHTDPTLIKQLEKYSKVVVALFPLDARRIAQIRLLNLEKRLEELKHFRIHGVQPATVTLIEQLQALNTKTCLAFFGNPFGLQFVQNYSSLINGYEDDPEAQAAAARLLLGVDEHATT